MRGLILSPTPITNTDGRSLRLRRHARALGSAGYDVTILAPDLDPDLPGVELIRSPTPIDVSDPHQTPVPGWSEVRHVGKLVTWLPLLWHTFRHVRPEVIVLPTFAPEVLQLVGLGLGHLCSCKVVYDYDDPLPENGWAKKGWAPGSPGWRLHRWIEWLLVRHSHRVVVTNEPMLQLLQRASERRDHLLVFNSPLLGDPVPPAPQGPIRVGYIGYLQPGHRGLEQLLECWAALDQASRPQLMLIGGGPATALFERLVADLDLGDSVEITGHLDQTGVHAALSRCHYTIIPYPLTAAHHHALPTKLFESVAHGRPVIVPPLESLEGLPEHWFVTYDGTTPGLAAVVQGLPGGDLAPVDLGVYSDKEGRRILSRLYRSFR